MEHLYSFVDVAGDWKNKIQLLETVIIKIAKKTGECAEFIQKYASQDFASTLMNGFIKGEDTSDVWERSCGASNDL